MATVLEVKYFRDIDISDPFFDSLKTDYSEFPAWFKTKSAEQAYTQYDKDKLIGFMYLKLEHGVIGDVTPPLTDGTRIKIGTLKVNPHGTKLGERLIKKAIDHAIVKKADEIYLTIFPRHTALISLLEGFGFKLGGKKTTTNGTEQVLIKSLDSLKSVGDIRKDYPMIDTRSSKFYLLGIKPQWHSQLFPDSILKTESYDLIADVTPTNSISKTYICAMKGVEELRTKDLLIIYRTNDFQGPAEYRSVATSICVVEEVRHKKAFAGIDDYMNFTTPFSVLSDAELKQYWNTPNLFVIKMLYNAAFVKRVIRKSLVEDMGLKRSDYWGFMPLSRNQFLNIGKMGGIDGRLIIG